MPLIPRRMVGDILLWLVVDPSWLALHTKSFKTTARTERLWWRTIYMGCQAWKSVVLRGYPQNSSCSKKSNLSTYIFLTIVRWGNELTSFVYKLLRLILFWDGAMETWIWAFYHCFVWPKELVKSVLKEIHVFYNFYSRLKLTLMLYSLIMILVQKD